MEKRGTGGRKRLLSGCQALAEIRLQKFGHIDTFADLQRKVYDIIHCSQRLAPSIRKYASGIFPTSPNAKKY